MKFETPNCPICGGPAEAIVEAVTYLYPLLPPEDGEQEYDTDAGGGDPCWESSEPRTFGNEVTLACDADGHSYTEWESVWLDMPVREETAA